MHRDALVVAPEQAHDNAIEEVDRRDDVEGGPDGFIVWDRLPPALRAVIVPTCSAERVSVLV